MAPLEELQELWQQQPNPPATPAADLTRSLHAYGRHQRWINSAKALLVLAILGGCFFQARHSLVQSTGVLVIAAAAAALLVRDWRSQQAIARGDFAVPSTGFLDATIDRLLAQRNVRRSYYWTLIGATILGENLILTGTHKLWPRLVGSLAPFAALEFGLWVRRRRFDYECRPLIDQLRAARAALEERAR